ncbi:MAG TPA: DNA methyltransferase [Acidimicrobiales bacterium]|nr:DNA methyltransferase [Acidimicrobiales bacterium]
MREHFPDESVDLVYLDPPFKPNEQYNVLFRDRGAEGASTPSAAQVRAFEDTWQWGTAARVAFNDVKENAPSGVRRTVEALHTILGFSNMFAYLAMMAPRLVELRRVMKTTASIYLHCDPAASHYLKLLMDAIFDPGNFRNEIIWRRTGAHATPRRFETIHDVILFYTKSDEHYFAPTKRAYTRTHVKSRYVETSDGKWQFNTGGNILSGPGVTEGESGAPWRGFNPTAKGRHWAIPGYLAEQMPDGFRSLGVLDRLDALLEAGLIEIKPDAEWPHPVKYLNAEDGILPADIWAYQPGTEGVLHETTVGIDNDVRWLGPKGAERLGYPTQKPEGLLDRIILASSRDGDIVLDPFCGCGTTIASAERLERYWLGIDITYDAIPIIRDRLALTGLQDRIDYEVWGSPETAQDAAKLASEDPYQFQWWAVRRLDGKEIERKKGADRGVDGRITLIGDVEGRFPEAIVSVKAGRTGPAHVRELAGTMQAQKVEIGVLVVLNPPTKAMREAADAEGGYPGVGAEWCPRIQILTAADIISGAGVKAPLAVSVSKKSRARGR